MLQEDTLYHSTELPASEDFIITAIPVKFTFAMNRIHSVPRDFTQGRLQPANQVKISRTSKLQGLHTPQWPPDSLLEIQATICSTKSASAFTTIGSTKINFQFPPPGSSTKSASASSLHHQAAAPNQLPVSTTTGSSTTSASKASSQSAVNSTTLPHPHHGSQVCCCLDIL